MEFGPEAIPIFFEKVTPVCSPGYKTKLQLGSGANMLERSRLIHLDAVSTNSFDWRSYLADLGSPAQETQAGLSFNTYSLVIQAAIAEQGVALGSLGLVDDLLASGVLTSVGPTVSATGRGYWLIPPRKAAVGTSTLLDWLRR